MPFHPESSIVTQCRARLHFEHLVTIKHLEKKVKKLKVLQLREWCPPEVGLLPPHRLESSWKSTPTAFWSQTNAPMFTTFSRISIHGRCHVLSCFNQFSGDALSCFALFRRTSWTEALLIQPEDLLRPLFKTIVYSRSWVRKLVNTTVISDYNTLLQD